MKKKNILTVFIIFLCIIELIPAVFILKECIHSYINGTTHGFNSDKHIFGIPAVLSTLAFTVAFFYPLYLLWFIILVITIILIGKRIEMYSISKNN